jgi:hypothetical protein
MKRREILFVLIQLNQKWWREKIRGSKNVFLYVTSQEKLSYLHVRQWKKRVGSSWYKRKILWELFSTSYTTRYSVRSPTIYEWQLQLNFDAAEMCFFNSRFHLLAILKAQGALIREAVLWSTVFLVMSAFTSVCLFQ